MSQADNYDVCMVFPAKSTPDTKNKSFSAEAIHIVQKIYSKFGKANLKFYVSVQNDEILVLIRITESIMREYANRNEYLLLANATELEARSLTGWPESSIRPIEINHDINITKYNPYQYIYLPFKSELPGPSKDDISVLQKLYTVYNQDTVHGTVLLDEEPSFFTPCDRFKILSRILEDSAFLDGLELKYRELMTPQGDSKEAVLIAIFPLHVKSSLSALKTELHHLRRFIPFNQPLQMINDYFGEKIALYYSFVGHFSLFLICPAIVGLATESVVVHYNRINHPIAPFYALFICLWGVFLMEFWKRKEKRIAMKHGMINFEETEHDREEFRHEFIINVTGKQERYYSPKKRSILVAFSFGIVFIFCGIVIGTTAGIYTLRNHLAGQSANSNKSSGIVASVLNAIQVQVYGLLYGYLSNALTDFENHKTDTAYEDSMIAKNFAFYFINAFSSFFFLAFFAGSIESPSYPGQPANDPARNNQGMCGYPTYMEALALNLGIILGSNLVVANITQVLIPLVKYRLKLRSESAKAGKSLTHAEIEYCKNDYDEKTLISDYMNIALLFGYMTLFISSLPGATFIVYLSSSVDVIADRFKLINLYRRPWPEGAEDIGTWQSIFELLITAAVVTNASLIVFTMELVNGLSITTQFFVFIGFQWVLFACQAGIRFAISDVPLEATLQQDRQKHFKEKLIDRDVDEFDMAYFELRDRDDSSFGSLGIQMPYNRRFSTESHLTHDHMTCMLNDMILQYKGDCGSPTTTETI